MYIIKLYIYTLVAGCGRKDLHPSLLKKEVLLDVLFSYVLDNAAEKKKFY